MKAIIRLLSLTVGKKNLESETKEVGFEGVKMLIFGKKILRLVTLFFESITIFP